MQISGYKEGSVSLCVCLTLYIYVFVCVCLSQSLSIWFKATSISFTTSVLIFKQERVMRPATLEQNWKETW